MEPQAKSRFWIKNKLTGRGPVSFEFEEAIPYSILFEKKQELL
jgi:hypothetical protein